GGTAVLNRWSLAHRLELLNRRLRNRERVVRAVAAADSAEEWLIIIRAIQHDVGVDSALAGETQLSQCFGQRLDRGRQGREILKSAPVNRQISDLILHHYVGRNRLR